MIIVAPSLLGIILAIAYGIWANNYEYDASTPTYDPRNHEED